MWSNVIHKCNSCRKWVTQLYHKFMHDQYKLRIFIILKFSTLSAILKFCYTWIDYQTQVLFSICFCLISNPFGSKFCISIHNVSFSHNLFNIWNCLCQEPLFRFLCNAVRSSSVQLFYVLACTYLKRIHKMRLAFSAFLSNCW